MPESEPPVERLRLRIVHFVVWGVACAVVVATRMAWTDWKSFTAGSHTFVRIGHVAVSLTYGAGLASLLIVLWNRRSAAVSPPEERTFPVQPGHWLLLFMASVAAADGVITLLKHVQTRVLTYDPLHQGWRIWHDEYIARFSMAALLCFVFACWISKDWKWKVTLLLPGSVATVFVVIHILSRVGIDRAWLWYFRSYADIATAIGLLSLVIAVATVDRRRHSDRDWLHGCGVVVFLAMLVMTAIDRSYWLPQDGILWLLRNQSPW